MVEIRETLQYQPAEEMWQLCTPEDLNALDADLAPQAVRFASRLTKEALAGTLQGEEPIWTPSGSYAGLLRLVPLRSRFVDASWSETSSVADPSFVADPPGAGPSSAADPPSVVEPS